MSNQHSLLAFWKVEVQEEIQPFLDQDGLKDLHRPNTQEYRATQEQK